VRRSSQEELMIYGLTTLLSSRSDSSSGGSDDARFHQKNPSELFMSRNLSQMLSKQILEVGIRSNLKGKYINASA
jgi:hypothetical protein